MKYVGLTIDDATGHEAELESFIREYCICERPEIPHNIAYKAKGVNVYSDAFFPFSSQDMEALVGQLPFTATPIGVESPNVLIVSSVNFVLEFPYKGNTQRLMPTEFFTGAESDLDFDVVRMLEKNGCVRVYTE